MVEAAYFYLMPLKSYTFFSKTGLVQAIFFLDGSALEYADDVSIISTGKSATEAKENLQKLLHYISIWAVANGLSLNLSKCFVMFIPSSPHKAIDNMLQVELSGQA